MDEDIAQLLAVMRDAQLEGNDAALAQLGAQLASRLGVSEAGGDAHGLWLRFEVEGASQRMRWVWPGRFMMGSPETEAGRLDRENQHEVQLTRGYWLGETAVTQVLWEAAMGDNPSWFRSKDRPVEQVSWHDCQQFCARLAALVPLLHPRLPSEAQWEYAARAGTTTATYNGDLDIKGDRAPQLDAIAWYWDNSAEGFELEGASQGTHPVRGKRANDWGLYDMLGNVFEWCADATEWDLGLTPYESGKPYDPLSTRGPYRVLRGGSWSHDAGDVRAALRLAGAPGDRLGNLGFRLAGGALRGGAQGREPRDGAEETGAGSAP